MRKAPDLDDERPTARAVLAVNVRKLIDAAKDNRPEIASILKVALYSKKLSHGRSSLSKSRVGRIVKGEHATDVDALGDLAAVFELEPWQLLVEGLNPEALPSLSTTPMLQQIRALVAAQPPEISHQVDGTFSAVTPRQHSDPESAGRNTKAGPLLKSAMISRQKGEDDGEGAGAKTVSKPRSNRGAKGNARPRRRG